MVLCSVLICALAISFVSGAKIPCEDKASYCNELNVEKCRPPNVAWATKNCPLRCGLCGSNSVDPDATNTGTNDKSKSGCTNKRSDCYTDTGVDRCRPPNKKWAMENCRLRCGLCDEKPDPDPTQGPTVVVDPNVPCVAEVDLLCVENWKEQLTGANGGALGSTNTAPRNSCQDKLSNCHNYNVTSCRAPYLAWAKDKCERRCGLCGIDIGGPKPTNSCKDKLSNCQNYGVKSCRAPYLAWAKKNCEKRCDLCNVEVKVDVTTPTKKETCDDFGTSRDFGSTWIETKKAGDQHKCQCEEKGHISCSFIGYTVKDNIKRSCNYRGKTWAYGYRWIETRAGGNNYDCECMTYGRIDCIFAGTEKQSCYDHGQKRLYGQRWVERRSSGAQYDCKCMENARIDCIVVSNCHDDNQSCYGWALKGECTINPRYMLLNCRRSCGRC